MKTTLRAGDRGPTTTIPGRSEAMAPAHDGRSARILAGVLPSLILAACAYAGHAPPADAPSAQATPATAARFLLRPRAVDPATAARLAPNDSQRIQRALEVFMLTGQPMSAWLAAPRRVDEAARPWRFTPIALEPSDRSVLHERIARRFDMMLAAGFVDEVKRLRARGDLHPGLPSMRCVGYRQVWEYLDGAVDHDTMRDKGVFATRQLCKRQLTWLRSMPERIVIDCCAADATAQALHAIEKVVSGPD